MMQTVSIDGADLRLFRAIRELKPLDIFPTESEAISRCLLKEGGDEGKEDYEGCIERLRDAGLVRIVGERKCNIDEIDAHEWEAI